MPTVGQLEFTIVFKIEGIRIKGTSTATNVENGFYFGELSGLPTTSIEWIDSALVNRTVAYVNTLDEVPATISADVNLFTSEYSISAPSIALVADEMMTELFFQMSKDTQTGVLTAALSDSATSCTIEYGGTIEAGDSLYIADECIYVSSVDSYSGGVYTLTIVRKQGWLGKAGSYIAGAEIYVNFVPYFNLRRCKMEIYDNTTSSIIFNYIGVIDNVVTNEDTTQIVINSRDLISLLLDVELPTNRDLFRGSWNNLTENSRVKTLGLIDPVQNNNFENYQFAVERKLSGQNTYDIGSPYKTWRIKDTVYASSGSYDASSGGYQTATQFFNNETPVFYNSISIEDLKDIKNDDSKIFETLSFQKETPFAQLPWDIRADETTTSYDRPPDTQMENISDYLGRNPIAIVLVLMLSSGEGTNRFTYGDYDFQADLLSKAWGGNISPDILDKEAWANLLDATRDIRVDNLNLGYDEGKFVLKDVILDLLRLVDAFIFINQYGQISIAKYESFDFSKVEENLNLEAQEQNLVYLEAPKCKLSRESGPQNVIGEIGGMPGQQKTNMSIVTLTGDRRDSSFNTSKFVINYEFYDRNKALRGNREFSDIELKLRNYKSELAESSPYLECTVPYKYKTDTGIQPGILPEVGKVPQLASWVIIRGTNEIIGPNGGRIIINDEENWVIFLGRITGYTLNLRNMTYDLKVYLQNWKLGTIPKLLAPSGRIDSYDAGTKTITLDTGIYDTPTGTIGFREGDQITLVDELGRPSYLLYTNSGYDTIDTISGHDIVLLNGLSDALPTDMIYYVRLAKYDEYSNTTAESYLAYLPASQRRLWAFLSDNTKRLGDDNDSPDIWAF